MGSRLLHALLSFLLVLATCGTETNAQTADEPNGSLENIPLPQVDFSGLDAFWTVADTLATSNSLDERDWQLLFSAPGYNMLSGRYPLRYPIVEAMKLTFNPQRSDERESVERSTVWMRPRMIRHFRRVKAHRHELKAFRHALARDDSLVIDVLHKLHSHLPTGALTDRYPPRIAFVLFLDDGYASPNVVAIDLWMAYSMERDALVRFIAHELFHSYRSSISRQRTDSDNGYVTMLVGALEQLENEGIADRIDKPAMLERDLPLGTPLGDYSQDYRMAYADAPTVVTEIDRLLARMERRQRFSPETVRRVQRAIPMGGHPTGAFMADVIVDQSGSCALRATVGRVFSFLQAYHRAAQMHPSAPAFSDDALAMIDRLDAWTSSNR